MAMKLWYSPASPFVRKVVVFAHEVGLADSIEFAIGDLWSPDCTITQENPLGKIPALVTPVGVFAGSYLCCDYLDSLHTGTRLIPHRSARALARASASRVCRRRHRSRGRKPDRTGAPAEGVRVSGDPRPAARQNHPNAGQDRLDGPSRWRQYRVDNAGLRTGLSGFSYAAIRLAQRTWCIGSVVRDVLAAQIDAGDRSSCCLRA